MVLGWDIRDGLLTIRREAESIMTETVVCGEWEDATDPATGDAIRTLTTGRYTGKGRIRYPSRAVLNVNQAAPAGVLEPVLSIPHGAPQLFDGDEVEVAASAADAALVGRRFKVQGRAAAGQTSAHRYLLQELT